MPHLTRLLRRTATVSPSLVGLTLAMLVLTAGAVAGLFLDPRLITGAPAWLKPLKFAISTAIYALSFAWVMGHVRDHPRAVAWITGATAATLAIEVVLIDLQALRGTSSHFNIGTPLDSAIFSAMGVAIVVLWICQLAGSVLLLRQRGLDPVLAWSLRLGLLLTAAGAAVGFIMVSPRPEQLEALRRGVTLLSGSHTLGGADGGPGLALLGWSREHGDLRAAHFLGLHALQFLPLLGWLLGRTRLATAQQVRLVWTASASFLGLGLLLVWQALRGQSVVAPDPLTLAVLSLWLLATVATSTVALAVPARAVEAA